MHLIWLSDSIAKVLIIIVVSGKEKRERGGREGRRESRRERERVVGGEREKLSKFYYIQRLLLCWSMLNLNCFEISRLSLKQPRKVSHTPITRIIYHYPIIIMPRAHQNKLHLITDCVHVPPFLQVAQRSWKLSLILGWTQTAQMLKQVTSSYSIIVLLLNV